MAIDEEPAGAERLIPTDDGNAHATAPGPPVLFIADGDPEARAVTESALARRFGSDYRVLAADTK